MYYNLSNTEYMKNSVFEADHYRTYLKHRLAVTGASRGLRSRLAEKIRTQPAFISMVLSGDNDLSPEHIPPTNELLGHSPEEAHFFTLLVFQARAGTKELREYFQAQLTEILSKRTEFLNRVQMKDTLKLSDQTLYYSRWYYLAIHVLVSLAKYDTREALAERLKLPLAKVSKAVDELVSMGLVAVNKGKLGTGKQRIHMDKRSPLIGQLHTNFRNQAIQSLQNEQPNDLHFSLGFTMSHKLFKEYRARLLDVVTEFEQRFLEDDPEEFFCLNIDFFVG